jgi:hypothetical protein
VDERLPENVIFDFLIANLGGSEDEIRPLIVAGSGRMSCTKAR